MALNVANFTSRLGKLFGYANAVNTQVSPIYVANISSVMTTFDGTAYRSSVANIAAQAINQTGLPSTIGQVAYTEIQNSISAFIIDAIRQEESVYDGTLATALKRLRDVMVTGSRAFQEVGTSSIAYTATSGNQGNGTGISRAYRPASSSVFLQEMFTESIYGTCTSGGTNQNFGVATFVLTGLAALDRKNTQYPNGVGTTPVAGSGLRMAINSTSASITAPNGRTGISLLSNGDFESWSTNTPTNWTITVGTAGTQVLRGTVTARGTYSLQMVGSGGVLTTLRQQIASSNGAPASVSAETNYCISFLCRVASSGSTGTVNVALRDSAGTVVGTAITLDLSTLSASTYAAQSVTFSVARGSLPTTLYLDIYSTITINAGKSLLIDELIFAPMIPLYLGGPSVIITNGTTDWNQNDSFNVAVVSNSTSAGKYIKAFGRYCQTESQGIYLPVSTGSPTDVDSLLTL